MFTTEKSYGIYRRYGYSAFQMEPVTMLDGRKLSKPSERTLRYLKYAIDTVLGESYENGQFVFVAKMLFGRIPLGGTFYTVHIS